MQTILDFLKSENYLIVSSILIILLLIGFLIILFININLKNKYKKFMIKIGNGENIEEDLEKFIKKAENIENQNKQIIKYCQNLDDDMTKCVQKIGLIRYNAYENNGNNLSFAVALLDENNDGVVFNGIYSREMSNIYAKPVKNGNSEYNLSEEEQKAVNKAIKK